MNTAELEDKAKWVRRQALEMIVARGKGHIGGSLSCVDILVSLYYGGILKFDPANPFWDKRDRFILSKGHACASLYAILADLGFFPAGKLSSYAKGGSSLGGHPDRGIPGIEANTGSLGHGLGLATGLALSARIDKAGHKVVVLLGDGECHEGSVWEAAMFAGHHKFDNLIAIVDRNSQCVTDFTEDCNRLEPFGDKWKSFGWDVAMVNGHSFSELIRVFRNLYFRKAARPVVVIAKTIKGKGVSFMERELKWHHSVPVSKDLETARKELT